MKIEISGENKKMKQRQLGVLIKQFASNKMYTLGNKKRMLDLDIVKGQWRLFDRAVAFGFKKTHFYTALK